MKIYLAIDIGASSGRHIAGRTERGDETVCPPIFTARIQITYCPLIQKNRFRQIMITAIPMKTPNMILAAFDSVCLKQNTR